MSKDDNLENLQSFFEYDSKIKELILDLAPTDFNKYNEDGMLSYQDKMEEAFKNLDYFFEKIEKCFDMEVYKDIINIKLAQIKNKSIQNYSNVNSTYEKCISGMDKKLIEEVKEEFKGYKSSNDFKGLINKSQTINELLHVIHSYVSNNETILKSLPILSQKENGQITLYGISNNIAEKIFEKYEIPKDFGETSIIGLKDKVLMMARDFGHALMIEMDTSKENVEVNYFIPKICNAKKVNELKGVKKVKEDANICSATTGMFDVDKKIIADEIVDFVNKVPTDDDIEMVNKYNVITDEEIEKVNQYDDLLEINREVQTSLAIIPQNRNEIFNWIKQKITNIKNRIIKNNEKSNIQIVPIHESSKNNQFKDRISQNGKLKDENNNYESKVYKQNKINNLNYKIMDKEK